MSRSPVAGVDNPPMTMLYGIAHCDTVKKARSWLDGQSVPYRFHDFKREQVPADRLQVWMATLGLDKLLNRRGTTWRALDAQQQAAAQEPDGAMRLMLAQPSVIRRPVVEWPDGSVTAGFDPVEWSGRTG